MIQDHKFLKWLTAIILLLYSVQGHAQGNFVLNSSFDQFTTCQNSLSVVYCTDWRAYSSTSTDYFNACATTASGDSVPVNLFGYQLPLHGNGYTGFYTNNDGPASVSYKEYIAGKLTPLMGGGRYKVSVWVSLADSSGIGTDDIGVFFYEKGPVSFGSPGPLPNTPQISYTGYGPVTDQNNWVQLSATFRADSNFNNLVIGGFSYYNSMGSYIVNSAKGNKSYYYLDSAEVVFEDTLGIACNDTLACSADTLHVLYAMQQGYFSSNNVLTLQLSGPTGSFANPVTIGTLAANGSGMIKGVVPAGITPGTGYKVRVIASNPYIVSNISVKSLTLGDTAPAKPVTSVNIPVCFNGPINLSATSSSPVTAWSWKGPVNFTSTVQNPSLVASNNNKAGNYIVSAYNYGCASKDTIAVTIQPMPITTTGTSNSPVCDNDTVKLSVNQNTAGTTYNWTGPNNYTSSQRTPTIFPVTTTNSGPYIITADLNGCYRKDTVDVIVLAIPAGISTHADSAICAGDTLHLYASSTTPGVSYLWTGPNSFSSTQANPVLPNAAAGAAGSYIIKYSNSICIRKDTVPVIVKPLPSPVVAGNSGPVCEGNVLSLSVTTGFLGTGFSWSGPNGFNSTLQNPAIGNPTMAANGSYIVTATLNGCSKKDTTTAVIKPVPVVNASNNGPVCSGQALSFSGTANLPGVGYSWTGPASFTSTLQDPVINNTTINMSGVYSLTATLNGCTSVADTTQATVKLTPATPTAGSNSPVCAGGILNLTAASSTTGVNYNWTGPNSFTSNQQNISISPASMNDAGTYNVTAELNGCMSTGSGSTTVVVNNVSSLGIYPSPNDTLCVNSANATFVAVPFNAGTSPQYQWYKNNNAVTGATNISYPASGIADMDSFYCRMTVTGLCAEPLMLYSNKIGMTVLPMTSGPTISIGAYPGTTLSPWQLVKFTVTVNNAGTKPQYQWKRNGQNVIGAIYDNWSAYNLSDGDSISCVVTSALWCADPGHVESNELRIHIKTGIEDIDKHNGINLYPNPNDGKFNLLPASSQGGGDVFVEVVNAVGQVVYKENISRPSGTPFQGGINVSLPDVTNGVYLLRVRMEDGVKVLRFTVSR